MESLKIDSNITLKIDNQKVEKEEKSDSEESCNFEEDDNDKKVELSNNLSNQILNHEKT